jgi:hypothetical protein
MFREKLTTAAAGKHIPNPIYVNLRGFVANEKKVSVSPCESVADKQVRACLRSSAVEKKS